MRAKISVRDIMRSAIYLTASLEAMLPRNDTYPSTMHALKALDCDFPVRW
jgi:hypothetical protein